MKSEVEVLETKYKRDIFPRGDISKLDNFEQRTNDTRRARGEKVKTRERSRRKSGLVVYGAVILAAAGIGAGTTQASKWLNSGSAERTPAPAEVNQNELEQGQVPPSAG